ncbi:uncharacterized protein LOC102802608 [Saccoglossus kowalevskii]|uniref:Uncharacterized protein LOC102802608 n=1 Tax=Saccoglossus kowalevskii TaxID=10224 RepID=A0ABM0MX73_SACKO|nr:PREDICTED: uncharacterized protein LOC102802608 [Saccoglossus kowalevskii]
MKSGILWMSLLSWLIYTPCYETRQTEAPLYTHGGVHHSVEGDVFIVQLKESCNEKCVMDFIRDVTSAAEEKDMLVELQHLSLSMGTMSIILSQKALTMVRWLDEVEYVEEDQVVQIFDGQAIIG